MYHYVSICISVLYVYNLKLRDLRWIFEDRFVSEEGVYRAYTTDEKTNIDQKAAQITPLPSISSSGAYHTANCPGVIPL